MECGKSSVSFLLEGARVNNAQAEVIRDAVDEVEKEDKEYRIRRVPAISHIFQNAPEASRLRSSSRSSSSSLCNHLRGPRLKTQFGLIVGLRNPDLAVLQVENQNPTHVTPLIASLAKGYVREELVVIGPPPKKVDEVEVERQKRKHLEVLWKLIQRVKFGLLDVDWKKEDRVNAKSNFLRKIWVSDVIYQVGFFVLFVIFKCDCFLSQETLFLSLMENTEGEIHRNGQRISDTFLQPPASRVTFGYYTLLLRV